MTANSNMGTIRAEQIVANDWLHLQNDIVREKRDRAILVVIRAAHRGRGTGGLSRIRGDKRSCQYDAMRCEAKRRCQRKRDIPRKEQQRQQEPEQEEKNGSRANLVSSKASMRLCGMSHGCGYMHPDIQNSGADKHGPPKLASNRERICKCSSGSRSR